MGKYFYKGLAHVAIRTDDVQKSADFYINNLGFHLYNKKVFPDKELWFLENTGCILELSGDGNPGNAGIIDHFAIEVLGLDNLVEELKQKGVLDQSAEIETVSPNFYKGIRNCFVTGPSGERIELFEYIA